MASDAMNDPLYSLQEVAALTNTPIWTVRGWVREGRIQVERVGPLTLKRVRVRQTVLFKLFPHLATQVGESWGQTD